MRCWFCCRKERSCWSSATDSGSRVALSTSNTTFWRMTGLSYFPKEKLDKPVILQNVVFEVDKATLLPESVAGQEDDEVLVLLQEGAELLELGH